MRGRLAVSMGVVVIAFGACGDDENEETSAATTDTTATGSDPLYEEIANLSDEEQIERVGEAWAEPFAEGDEAMCAYLHPDLGGAGSCTFYTEGQLTQSAKVQQSFAGARAESVDVKGQTAVADFSNGERVTFQQDPEGEWKVLDVSGK